MRQAENKSTVKNQLMLQGVNPNSIVPQQNMTHSSQGLGMSTSRAAKESRERIENSAIQKFIIIIIMLQQ